MTLDISKYLTNLIKKEAKISHFQVVISAGKTSKINKSLKSAIKSQYGEQFLLDANYVIFFKKDDGWTSSTTKKLFDLVNRALGKDANNMTQSEFKFIKQDSDDTSDDIDNTTDDVADDNLDADSASLDEDEKVTADTTLFVKITIK